MKNWNVARRLFFGFAIVIVLTSAFGILALVQITGIKGTTNFMASGCYPGTIAIYEIESQMTRSFGLVGNYLIAPAAQRARLAAEIAQVKSCLDDDFRVYENTITSGEDRIMFSALKTHREQFLKTLSDIIQISAAGRQDEAIAKASRELTPLIDKILDEDLAPMVHSNRSSGERALVNISQTVARGVEGVTIGMACNIFIATVIAWLLGLAINRAIKDISSELYDGAQQVVSAASQISSASQLLAQGASNQAASLEETGSSLAEMASMTKRNSENAQQTNNLAKQTRLAADKGAEGMNSMSAAMEAIKASSDDVAKIVKTIDEIAFQTNILALNAAVEAARAGDAGLGFAVVADEVRNLAQRSAQAAKETAAKIEGAIAKSEQGVEISKKVSQALNEIVAQVRQVDELIAEVSNASHEQTQGITQINAAVGEIDRVTQSNAAGAEEIAASAEQLNAQAESMKESVDQLHKLVGGTAKTLQPPVPAAVPYRQNGHGQGRAISTRCKSRTEHTPSPSAVVGEAASARRFPIDGSFMDF